jgi:hypothetical protein
MAGSDGRRLRDGEIVSGVRLENRSVKKVYARGIILGADRNG